jgi:hypothetical protein
MTWKVRRLWGRECPTISESAFVVPGDYSVAFAVYDTATGEHAAKRDILHVLPLGADPLPDAVGVSMTD